MHIGGLFEDSDGTLALAPKQKGLFSHWARPSDISPVYVFMCERVSEIVYVCVRDVNR